MRGASYLAKLDNRTKGKSVIVVDVGGTTTDVGVLLPSGFPRKAAAFTEGEFKFKSNAQPMCSLRFNSWGRPYQV